MPKHAHLELQNNGRINIKIQSIELIAEILAKAALGSTTAIGTLLFPFDLPPKVDSFTTGADKTHNASKRVFSVFSKDENKKYDTIRSAWEFSKNQEQPQVSRLIRLEATLL